MKTDELIQMENDFGAHNYHPLDVVLTKGQGVWVHDVEGKRYMDCLSAYSAVNQGHRHPRIIAALKEQADRLTLTSRAFRNEKLPHFYKALVELTGLDRVLPMNSGAEAVETAVKMARKWGYKVKGIPDGKAEIIVFGDNFHGRTTTIVGFSTEEQYKDGFGPFTPGFVVVPYGDAEALAEAITPDTCAVIFEPIQGEAGIIVPPAGYLKRIRALCTERNVLMIADEIQTGLGRTGRLFACDHEDVRPDAYILGKALAGGCYPVSAVVARREAMDVFHPGDHGSTFGGNPLGCAIALEALKVLHEEKLAERSAEMGAYFMERLRAIDSPVITEVRGKGLLIGVELDRKARPYCEKLRERGILCKETHANVIRFAPPLVLHKEDVDWAMESIGEVLKEKL